MSDNPSAGVRADHAEVDIGLLRIDHVGVAVAELDPAIDFYTRVFGMRCVHREHNAEQGVDEAMLAVGPAGTGGHLQLLAPAGPDSAIGRFLQRHGPGLQQVAYTVVDVDAAAAALRGRGLRLLYDEARRGTAGSRINFVHPRDAGGVLVELVEPAEHAAARDTPASGDTGE
ncbi:MAG TPA: methylmalonyl-CoA epimerase [Pilimelia sp.]|nr:methylmalonyl-CoA epimerase [Pilimelia sp.]